jgi:maltooligosyltrehalose trehalohydrolase
MGERLDQLSDPAACRAAAAVLLLAPETPLLFMGQEWAASTPFLYFTDHHEQLGRLVTEGRRREFRRFPAFSDPAARERIPDPQDDATFEASRLEWDETRREPHRLMLGLYRTLIDLRRRTQPRARIVSPATIAWTVDSRTLAIVRDGAERSLLLVARFGEPGRSALRSPADVEGRWELAVTTEDAGFANDPAPPRVQADGDSIVIDFARPSAVIFRRR